MMTTVMKMMMMVMTMNIMMMWLVVMVMMLMMTMVMKMTLRDSTNLILDENSRHLVVTFDKTFSILTLCKPEINHHEYQRRIEGRSQGDPTPPPLETAFLSTPPLISFPHLVSFLIHLINNSQRVTSVGEWIFVSIQN